MKSYIEERATEIAEYIIENNATVRQAAKHFGISKSNPLLKDLVTILPSEKTSPQRVYIHSDGKITISGKLNADIKTRQIEIRISSDAKRMALIPNGEHAHRFTKAGGTRNDELSKKLKSKHFSMPVTYMMEQDEKSGIWIGKMRKTPRNSKEK